MTSASRVERPAKRRGHRAHPLRDVLLREVEPRGGAGDAQAPRQEDEQDAVVRAHLTGHRARVAGGPREQLAQRLGAHRGVPARRGPQRVEDRRVPGGLEHEPGRPALDGGAEHGGRAGGREHDDRGRGREGDELGHRLRALAVREHVVEEDHVGAQVRGRPARRGEGAGRADRRAVDLGLERAEQTGAHQGVVLDHEHPHGACALVRHARSRSTGPRRSSGAGGLEGAERSSGDDAPNGPGPGCGFGGGSARRRRAVVSGTSAPSRAFGPTGG